ncbi:hypothetical protein C8Q70DRAFT_1068080 [Cubamyces menziesii]|uniref:Uncharacterized protein n=1 Tax=Trametes cubensis TaxID=1111947 RepID=A0AAD7U3D6_9APHY|nr:hypothetical protein C8Q70DRAFT_1068080 [Cubamyces menziesii]KAJ8501711.1 hypothetical protein ONZ51_g486 [Trametes cubensis]
MLSQSSSLSKALILTIASLCIFFQLAVAVPAAEVEKRTVFTPLVTYPHTGTVWYKGQTHNVTWDTSDAPSSITGRFGGRIQLRKGDTTTPLILQSNFDVLLGRIEVVVPWVLSDTDYSLVFFGDSGDLSEQFTIME